MKTGFVYFLRAADGTGPIKIGSSTDPQRRLQEMKRWSPVDLDILCLIEGGINSGKNLERNLHNCFADDHLHFEWFNASPRLVDAVAAMSKGVPVHVAVDLSDVRGNVLGARYARKRAPKHLLANAS